MRIIITFAAAAAMAVAGASAALAKGNPAMKSCATAWKTAPHAGTTYKAYMTSCLAAAPATAAAPRAPMAPAATPMAPTPAAPKMAANAAGAPAGATAVCKDGTYSMSKHHSGSCSGHHGVANFLQ